MARYFRLPLALLAAFALIATAFAGRKDGTLEVYWIDSEGGGSTLIVTPQGESVLIDTGNPGGRDPGRIVAAARGAGLERLDYVLLTHFHGDHFGGGAEVAQTLPFGVIYERKPPEADPDGRAVSTYPVLIKAWKEIPARRATLAAGVTIPLRRVDGQGAPRLELRCMGADQAFVDPTEVQRRVRNPLTGSSPPQPTDTSDNANSAVFLLTFGDFRFFDGGDLTWNLEERLVTPYNLAGEVDVYQTNHHGLAVSNNPVLVRSLAPTVVVMNNGPKKGGQQGAFNAIKAAANSVRALYQLHRSFNVPDEENTAAEFIANHANLTGADAAKCAANVIKMTVAADGRSYTMSIPATGHAQTYPSRRR